MFAADEQSQPLKASPPGHFSPTASQQLPPAYPEDAHEEPAPMKSSMKSAAPPRKNNAPARMRVAPPPLKEPLTPLKNPVKTIELTGDKEQDMKLLLGQLHVLQASSPQTDGGEGGGAAPASPKNDAPPLSAFEDLCDITKSLVQTGAPRPSQSPKPPASPTFGGGAGAEAGEEEDDQFKQETAIKEQMKSLVRQPAYMS